MTIDRNTQRLVIGIVTWFCVWSFNYFFMSIIRILNLEHYYDVLQLALKIIDLLVIIGIIAYSCRKWGWTLSDWGFTISLKFLLVFIPILIVIIYLWIKSDIGIDISIKTIRQSITGIWEELFATVFLTRILVLYFKERLINKSFHALLLSVIISAILFIVLHIGQWQVNEYIINGVSFIAYRIAYLFSGSFIVGLLFHGTSNNQ